MRYSMLAYLTRMTQTLLEAAEYLASIPDKDPLRAELLENGRRMLGQIQEELERHKADLRTGRPVELLGRAQALWETSGAGLVPALQAFALCLQQEVRYQVRAVFFTGLGATWDAMESVYAYMREDPRFDPVVVLIPVFRQVRQGGQTKQEVTYTDYLTPMGIPFLEYNQYCLADDCPDLAFINQPYESVIPEAFWPETIAQQTRLVYLPYFPPFSVFESTQEALCELPVYRHAWKVIGSSERYARYYRKHARNGGGNMLVTGVPKWDPIIRLRTCPAEIPAAWREAVQGRKVFLWNSFYDFDGSSIPHFEDLYRWFQAHPECALIWRTHPMTDTVTKLYYPEEYYERFQRYVALTDAAPNMIFDREASYEAAFCCSDAQISDLSSMMFQYLLLDKPVLYIETSGRGKVEKEFFIDDCWMDRACNARQITGFLEEICGGVDKNRDLRELVRQRDLPLADGKCGIRVCESLWELMHREDGLPMENDALQNGGRMP